MEIKDRLIGREVRLFSSASISNDQEAESRATAALLSTIKAVSEFGRAFVQLAGGPAGRIDCFTEISFHDGTKNPSLRPDGVVLVSRGKTKWTAMVELKVASNGISQDQFDSYHDLARDQGYDAFITISNQPAMPNGLPPLKVHKSKARGLPVTHLSWERLLSEAQLLSWQSGVADEDQKYILDEWIRYVNDQKSRIVVSPKVGPYWGNLLTQATTEKLSSVKSDLEEFLNTWNGFLRIEAFRLRAMLGENVEVRMSRNDYNDPDSFLKRMVNETSDSCRVESALKIPKTAGDLLIVFDIKGKCTILEIHVKPPSDKTTRGQIGWMISQLKHLEVGPDQNLIVDWRKKGVMSMAPISGISDVRDSLMISTAKEAVEKDNEIRLFRLQQVFKLPSKSRDFFSSLGRSIEEFYQSTVQYIQTYSPAAPKVSEDSLQPVNPMPKIIQLPSWVDEESFDIEENKDK